MNRTDLQRLAEDRIRDCEALMHADRFSGAYYMGGYAAECGLKACIATNIREFEFPDKRSVQLSYSHNLSQLLGVAGLERVLGHDMKVDRKLGLNWSLVKDWSEDSRYDTKSKKEAVGLYQALADPSHGVMKWLRSNW